MFFDFIDKGGSGIGANRVIALGSWRPAGTVSCRSIAGAVRRAISGARPIAIRAPSGGYLRNATIAAEASSMTARRSTLRDGVQRLGARLPRRRAPGRAAERLVRDLRDTAVELGMQVDGCPFDEATLDYALAKYSTRLTAVQRIVAKNFWRRIEGGGGA